MTTLSEADVALIRANQCPVCKNFGFIPGPRGGAGQNIFCCNPGCRAGFNVAPRHNICMASRSDDGPDNYYPPKVHILRYGRALCNFSGSFTVDNGPPPRILPMTPDMWPIGHCWVGQENYEEATCVACRAHAAH